MQFQKISIPTPWKFRGGGGSQKPKFLKEKGCMGLNWNFQWGGRFKLKNLPWEGYGTNLSFKGGPS